MIEKPSYDDLEKQIEQLKKKEAEFREKEVHLRESEHKYQKLSDMLRLMCDNVPDMIWAKDLEKRFTFANKAICRHLLNAADTHEPIGKTDLFFAERERSRFPDNLDWHTFGEICRDWDQITMDAGIPMQFDEFGNVKGQFLFLDVHKAPFLDENGKMIGIVGSARNITEHKKAEKALQESEEQYRILFEHTNEALFVAQNGNIVFPNPRTTELSGYSVEELQSKPFINFIHEDDRRKVMDRHIRRIRGETPPERYSFRIIHSSGTILCVQLNAVVIQWNGKPATLNFMSDITKRKKAEDQLKEREERYRLLFNMGVNAMFLVDNNTTQILECNSKAAQLFGYSSQELLSMKMTDLSTTHEATRRACQEKVSKKERVYQTKDGSFISVDITSEHFYLANRAVHISAIQDITEKKRAEYERDKLQDQLSQAQKAESLGRMAGAIAHHFNNQLSVMMGNLELVLDDLPDDAENRENLSQAFEAGHKAAEVSQQMLRYLGHISGSQTTIDLSDVCRKSLAFLQSALPSGVTLNVDFPDSGPFVHADADQIQQVLTNLFINAQESLPDNQGIIGLIIQTVSHEDISASNSFPLDWQPQDIPYACLEVSDTGCGISSEDIGKIVDPFFSTKFTGRGMGLPVTMGILKAHNGCITVDSEPESGTVFRVYLPVTTEKKFVNHEKETPRKENVGNCGTELLIEDEASVRNMAKKMLSRLGYKVIEAKDGVEAVRLFQQHQNVIDCVLSDLTMPRMNGWETLTALRKMAADVPVILASGYDQDTVMAGDHPELPQAFLNKPYSMAALKDVLMEVIKLK